MAGLKSTTASLTSRTAAAAAGLKSARAEVAAAEAAHAALAAQARAEAQVMSVQAAQVHLGEQKQVRSSEVTTNSDDSLPEVAKKRKHHCGNNRARAQHARNS